MFGLLGLQDLRACFGLRVLNAFRISEFSATCGFATDICEVIACGAIG